MSTIKTNNIKSLDGTVTMTVQELRAMLDGGSIGVNQTWQDVSSSRVIGTTYTNTSGAPIKLRLVENPSSGDTDIRLTIGIMSIRQYMKNTDSKAQSISEIIPNGSTYVVTSSTATLNWFELR